MVNSISLPPASTAGPAQRKRKVIKSRMGPPRCLGCFFEALFYCAERFPFGFHLIFLQLARVHVKAIAERHAIALRELPRAEPARSGADAKLAIDAPPLRG